MVSIYIAMATLAFEAEIWCHFDSNVHVCSLPQYFTIALNIESIYNEADSIL